MDHSRQCSSRQSPEAQKFKSPAEGRGGAFGTGALGLEGEGGPALRGDGIVSLRGTPRNYTEVSIGGCHRSFKQVALDLPKWSRAPDFGNKYLKIDCRWTKGDDTGCDRAK